MYLFEGIYKMDPTISNYYKGLCSEQVILAFIYKRLEDQGEPCLSPDSGGRCRYRYQSLVSPVGCLMDDTEYSSRIEGIPPSNLVASFSAILGASNPQERSLATKRGYFLDELERVHEKVAKCWEGSKSKDIFLVELLRECKLMEYAFKDMGMFNVDVYEQVLNAEKQSKIPKQSKKTFEFSLIPIR